MWRLAQWKECDGVGCCDTNGLFTDDGFHGQCAMWEDKRCLLMQRPALLGLLRPAERRAFAVLCTGWPIPERIKTLDRTYTDSEREALNMSPSSGCCYRWEEIA